MRFGSAVGRRVALATVAVTVVLAVGVGVATASNIAVGLGDDGGDVDVPTWLYLATGGGVIGASALLSMLVTDRAFVEDVHDRTVGVSTDRVRRAGALLLGTLGVAALAFVLLVGVFGPRLGSLNAAVLLTFVGVRAGTTTFAYAVGNPWPAINPWRRIAAALPNGFAQYPSWLGSWPAVAGVLGFVWIEIVTPLSTSAPSLAALVAGYSALTIAGAVVFSPEEWFRRADPISVWFRFYGAVAPIQRTSNGFELRAPGSRLAEDDVLTDLSAVAFAIALVWELTYSGFVVTPYGAGLVEALVGVGLAPSLVYLGLLIAGFGLFCWVYWRAAERSRERAETYLSRRYLAIRYAPPLFAIAAGYHFAHYAGFTLSLWPSLVETVTAPISPVANPTVLALPWWFGYVEIAGILLGHVLAIWVAHTVSLDLFPGKLQAIRSQYPFVVVMILFTMASLWLISLPAVPPPYAPG